MKRFWLVAVLAIFAVSIGCGGGGGAEGAAKSMLDAMKKGDAEGMLKYVDLKSVYDQIPEEAREAAGAKTYDDFLKKTAAAIKEGYDEDPDKFKQGEYSIEGSEVKDDVTIVKVKMRENKDAEWEEVEFPFKKVDGKWKISAEDMDKLGD